MPNQSGGGSLTLVLAERDSTIRAALQRLGKPHRLKIYPPVGQTEREGHDFVYLTPPVWQRDRFRFLDERLRR